MRMRQRSRDTDARSIDRKLTTLTSELKRIRGEPAAEAALLEQIDELLDSRIAVTDAQRSTADRPVFAGLRT